MPLAAFTNMSVLLRRHGHAFLSASPLRPRLQSVPPSLSRRPLHLAPPFLLDDYTPRYQSLTSVGAAKKCSLAYAHLRNCNLCPRLCAVNRYETTGYCLIPAQTCKVSVIAPHFGEEPCITGHNGSGSVFFSGCNLRCVFCQNHEISHQRSGFDLTPEELAEWMIKLQEVGGVHNINFVTPEHVVPQVALAIMEARDRGLNVPIVYNTSSFDSLASLELMDGLVDIYLPDFKVWTAETGKRLLKSEDYAAAARESIKEMYRQVGDLCFTGDGLAKRGVLVRHLVMPGYEQEGVHIVGWLAENVGKDTFVHVMEQYRPDAHVGKKNRGKESDVRYEEINRAIGEEEIGVVKRAAKEAGLWRFAEAAKHGGFNI
jgi:putative pyruvate formate lyase activating enzyme